MVALLKLPLVISLIDQAEDIDLSSVRIIGAQHILETTHAMFQEFFRLGLKPENVSLIGKCYSTCTEVLQEMIEDGIDVAEASVSYDSHRPFDELYCEEIKKFLDNRIESITSSEYDVIIALDDGGKFIKYLKHLDIPNPIVAIEQTTAGYDAIKNLDLQFPVINVARSPLKLDFESPMIAQAAAERLEISLRNRNLRPEKALIIGGGAIGDAMRKRLSPNMEVMIYDQSMERSDFEQPFEDIIEKFPLIIGCTGKTSIPYHLHGRITSGTTLVSVSSSDREFDAAPLRNCLPKNPDCHLDLDCQNIYLINSGFPVNFDGDRENIAPEKIQLTIALIAAAILQAVRDQSLEHGICPLDPISEKFIKTNFLCLENEIAL